MSAETSEQAEILRMCTGLNHCNTAYVHRSEPLQYYVCAQVWTTAVLCVRTGLNHRSTAYVHRSEPLQYCVCAHVWTTAILRMCTGLNHCSTAYVHRSEPLLPVWAFTACSRPTSGRLYPTIIVLYNITGIFYLLRSVPRRSLKTICV